MWRVWVDTEDKQVGQDREIEDTTWLRVDIEFLFECLS